MNSEENLIERLVRTIPSFNGVLAAAPRQQTGLHLGTGDDAAILSPRPRQEIVLSCDAFLEGVHFLRGAHPPDSVGYKALARAVSDLAAMGASPTVFFLTLALPAELTGGWLDRFAQGMARAAKDLGIRLAGGDTSAFSSVAISLTVLGEVERGHALQRTGARQGDVIYVSGCLGRAELGLEIIRRRGARPHLGGLSILLKPHLYPKIRLDLGVWLARNRIASAMMDLSDGLSMDLPRLCRASGVGARIFLDEVPKVRIRAKVAARLKARGVKLDPIAMALNGGEDYELLFTVPLRKVAGLKGAPGFRELRAIGEILPRRIGIATVESSGNERPLREVGWDSFQKKQTPRSSKKSLVTAQPQKRRRARQEM